MPKCRSSIAAAAFTLCIGALTVSSVWATQRYGPIEISGNLQSQNLIRHPGPTSFQFIQNRNTAHLRLDYEWLKGGKLMDNYDVPFISSSKLFVLYRGVYDSVYDTTPQIFARRDIHEKGYGGLTIGEFARTIGKRKQLLLGDGLTRDERDTFKFENQLREAYVDLKLRNIPLTVRAGKQQIVWGETDNFRMLDRANPLDLTWHLQQEIPAPAFGWDEIRQTQWMMKFLYDLGDIAGTSQNFLEWYWNPGDWRPAKQSFEPRPWGLPFMNSLTNPIDGVFFAGPCVEQTGTGKVIVHCKRLMNGTRLFGKGDYSRNPFDNSQVGVRYHTILPGGLETGLVYFYQRWAGDDGTNYAPLRAVLSTGDSAKDVKTLKGIISKGEFPAEAYHPYVHSLGMSMNYSDEEWSQAVFRLETIYDVGIPFFDVSKVSLYDNPALPGITRKNMWKGMIAFDRPTWIRTLNKKSTWFLTGQFFWHYLVNNPTCRTQVGNRTVEGSQDIAQLQPNDRRNAGSCLVGGLDLPSSVRSAEFAFRDKIRDWETLFTLAAFSFYRGGSIVPVLGVAVDPVNSWNMEAFWSVDYVFRTDLIINLGQKYFIQPHGHSTPIFETWGLGGFNAGRSETSLRITYQF